MQSKHTPGPYHVNAIANGRVIGDETCTVGVEKYQLCNRNATIATVYRPRDSALLKAAPDLLAACKAALSAVEANAERYPGDRDAQSDLATLRAAIARAEGGGE